jgi:GH15 family glucan-1,4-alpha-glucosidase
VEYKPIDNYGVIGDMHTAALVGSDGSIDWCCLPKFDSPSVFAALLDKDRGGYFRICTREETRHRQMYWPETNVMVTRFLNPDGAAEVIDFMPLRNTGTERREIVRIAHCVRGTSKFKMACFPAFDYARAQHEVFAEGNRLIFRSDGDELALFSSLPLSGPELDFELAENEVASFILRHSVPGDLEIPPDLNRHADELKEETIALWKKWVAKSTYSGRWREMVTRSALALKLLTYEPTGAIVAAPTCSLPEEIGGVRNWDYRYVWIRDAAFTIYAFLRLGYTSEATRFMEWLHDRAAENQETGPLQVMYRVDGSSDLKEFTLDHLDGYRGSRPVRVGNAASDQLQLDIYGELVDSIYLYNKHGQPISYQLWNNVQRMLEWLCDNWERPDHSVWEVRDEPRQYTYSKVQCWVAMERGMRIARQRGLPFDFRRIQPECNRIYEAIMEKGWSEEKQSFTQSFGSDAVDATSLLFPLMMFVGELDPRMKSTLDRIRQELVSDTLVYRYTVADGLPGNEGTFSVCSFWLVENLARSGKVDEALLMFEKMLTYANPLGLYAEQIGLSGEALGNFPQAFTHLGLISAALDLDRSLSM